MSCNVTKIAFRMKLDHLKNETDAYYYFRERGIKVEEVSFVDGEPETDPPPDDVLEVKREVEELAYKDLTYAKKNYKKFKDFVIPVYSHEESSWGVEIILGIMREDDVILKGLQPKSLVGHSINLKEYKEKLLDMNFPNNNVSLHCYTWYNGVDEPVTFK